MVGCMGWGKMFSVGIALQAIVGVNTVGCAGWTSGCNVSNGFMIVSTIVRLGCTWNVGA